MKKSILETDRLLLREMDLEDLEDLKEILQDKEAMYAYEHAFDDKETENWLARQLERYQTDGFGLWAVIRKSDSALVGQIGLTLQEVNQPEPVCEIGYLLKRKHWGKGYAIEAAVGCKRYAFETLQLSAVYSIIRDSNTASRRVAERNGMTPVGQLIKCYHGVTMPHIIYRITREE